MHWLITQRLALPGRRRAQLPHAAGNLGSHVVQRLRGFFAQQLHSLGAEFQAVLFHNGQSLLTGGGVRAGGAAGNHIQGIAQYVTEHDAEHPGGGAGLGKAPALYSAEPLTNSVHFHDIRSAGQELLCHILKFVSRDQRLFKQGAAAAGQQKDHRIVRAQIPHQLQGFFRGGKAVFVGNRVARLVTGHAGDISLHVFVLGDHHATVHMTQGIHSGFCHLPARLTGGYQ